MVSDHFGQTLSLWLEHTRFEFEDIRRWSRLRLYYLYEMLHDFPVPRSRIPTCGALYHISLSHSKHTSPLSSFHPLIYTTRDAHFSLYPLSSFVTTPLSHKQPNTQHYHGS